MSGISRIMLPIEVQQGDSYGTVNSSNQVITIHAAAIAGDYVLQLPPNKGIVNQYMKTQGTGGTYWSDVSIKSYTTAQRLNLGQIDDGTLVYDTTLAQAMMYNGGSWVSIGGGSSGSEFPETTFRITDSVATTKKLAFDINWATAAPITRTITVPDRDVNLDYASLMDQSVAQSATPTWANLNILEPSGPSSITLGAPALAANYSMTLPNSLPGVGTTGLLENDSTGASYWTATPNLNSVNITEPGGPSSITLGAPALAANYSMTLPNSLPGVGTTGVLENDSTGASYWTATPNLNSVNILEPGGPSSIILNAPALAATYYLTLPNALPAAGLTASLQSTDTGVASWSNEFTENTFRIVDSIVPTKKLAFDMTWPTVAPITRTITVPDRDIDLNYASLMNQTVANTASPTWTNSISLTRNAQTLSLAASATASGTYTMTMPPAVNTVAGQLLIPSDVAGTLTWSTSGLTNAEITQLANIDGNIIATANWTRVAALDQSVSTLSSPQFVTPLCKTSLKIEDPGVGTNMITVQAPALSANYTTTLPIANPTVLSNLQTDSTGQMTWAEDYENASNINLYQYPATYSISGGGLALKTAVAADDGTGTPTAPHVYEIIDSLTYTDDTITTATMDLKNKHDIVIRGAVGQRPLILCTTVLSPTVFGIDYTAAGAGTTNNITIGNLTANIVGSVSGMGFFKAIVHNLGTAANTVSNISFKDIFIYGTDYTTQCSNYGIVFSAETANLTRYMSNVYVEDCRFLNIHGGTDTGALMLIGVNNYIGRRNAISNPNFAGTAAGIIKSPPAFFSGVSGKEYYSSFSPGLDNQYITAGQGSAMKIINDSSTYSGFGEPVTFTLHGCTFSSSTNATNGLLRLSYRPVLAASKVFTVNIKKCNFVDSIYAAINWNGTGGEQAYEGMSVSITDSRFNNIPLPIVNEIDYDQPYKSLIIERNIYSNCGQAFTDLGTHPAAIPTVNVGYAEERSLYTKETRFLRADPTDGYLAGVNLNPVYNGAGIPVTRHNYINLANTTGTADFTTTNAAVMRFDATTANHKALAVGTTKAGGLNTTDGWVKVNVNGTIMYIPIYTSIAP